MKVSEGQSLFDLAIIGCGSAEAAFEMAVLNGISITDSLRTGCDLSLPDVVNADVVSFYANNNINPATLNDAPVLAGSGSNNLGMIAAIATLSLKPMTGQSFLDMAMLSAGDAAAAFSLALLNGKSITDDPQTGVELAMVSIINASVKNYYKNNGINPATGITIIGTSTRKRIFSKQFTKQFS